MGFRTQVLYSSLILILSGFAIRQLFGFSSDPIHFYRSAARGNLRAQHAEAVDEDLQKQSESMYWEKLNSIIVGWSKGERVLQVGKGGGQGEGFSFNAHINARKKDDESDYLSATCDKSSGIKLAAAISAASHIPHSIYSAKADPPSPASGTMLLPEIIYSGLCPHDETEMRQILAKNKDYGVAIKARHLSGCNLIMNGVGLVEAHRPCMPGEPNLTGTTLLSDAVLDICRGWSSMTDVAKHEMICNNAKPGVIFETRVSAGPPVDKSGADASATTVPAAPSGSGGVSTKRPGTTSIPADIKCFSFNGYTAAVALVTNRFDGWAWKADTFFRRLNFEPVTVPANAPLSKRDHLQPDTSPLHFTPWTGTTFMLSHSLCAHDTDASCVQAAAVYGQWVDAAAVLCDSLTLGMDFMRVDFLLSDKGLVFTEFTPFPNAGNFWWYNEKGHSFVDAAFDKVWARALEELGHRTARV